MHARDGDAGERSFGIHEGRSEHDRQRRGDDRERNDDRTHREAAASSSLALTFSRGYCHVEKPPHRVPTRTANVILSTASETNEKVTSFRSIRVIFVTANYYAICGPHHSSVTNRQKEGPAPQGSRECRAIEADWPAGGPARACLGSYEHPVVSPQFSHLWQVPFRTVSQPQRAHGGASGVELSRIP